MSIEDTTKPWTMILNLFNFFSFAFSPNASNRALFAFRQKPSFYNDDTDDRYILRKQSFAAEQSGQIILSIIYKYSNDDKSLGDNRSYPLLRNSIYLSAIHSETQRTRNQNDPKCRVIAPCVFHRWQGEPEAKRYLSFR